MINYETIKELFLKPLIWFGIALILLILGIWKLIELILLCVK